MTILKNCNDFLTLLENNNAEVDLAGADEPSFTTYSSLCSSKRKLKPNSQFNDFVLTESSGLRHRHENSNQSSYKNIYFEIFDIVIKEMDRRFFNNDTLYNLIDKASNLDSDNIYQRTLEN